jgi:integrase
MRRHIAEGVFDEDNLKSYDPALIAPDPECGAKDVGSLSRWFLEKIEKEIKPSTFRSYAKNLNLWVVPQFGKTKVKHLTRGDVDEWLNGVTHSQRTGRPLTEKTRREIVLIFKWMLKKARLHGVIPREWDVLTDYPLPVARDYIPDPFGPGEIESILSRLSPPYLELAIVAMWTGGRTGELLKLEWQNVNFNAGTLWVNGTKTEGSARSVALLPPAAESLRRLHENRRSDKWVFARSSGLALSRNTVHDHWKRAVRRAGVRYRRFYNLRATYATLMLGSGRPALWVAGQLGHTSFAMLEQHYARWSDSLGSAEEIRGYVEAKCGLPQKCHSPILQPGISREFA